MHARIVRVAAFAAVVLLAVGCTKTLDTSNLETTLGSQMKEQLGLASVEVACPDSLKVQAGTSFTCTATAPDSTFEVTVTQIDDKGSVNWKVSDASGSSSVPSASPSA
jgi:hypothetical protein